MAVSEAGGPSPGEWSGIIAAGGVAAGATFKGLGVLIRWWGAWRDARAKRRDEKLAAWHDELVADRAALNAEREALYDGIRAELIVLRREVGRLRSQNSALRNAFELMAAPVRAVTPDDERLVQAEQILSHAFRIDPLAPVDFAEPLTGLGMIAGSPRAPRHVTDGKEV